MTAANVLVMGQPRHALPAAATSDGQRSLRDSADLVQCSKEGVRERSGCAVAGQSGAVRADRHAADYFGQPDPRIRDVNP